MSARSLVLISALILSPVAAHAQITGFVAQPKSDAPSAAVVASTAATADSARQTRLTDMRAWVDSAAGSLGVQAVATDSASMPVTTFPSATPAPAPSNVPATQPPEIRADMRTGVRAPNTSTMLPLLALVGAVFLSAGTFLVSTRRPRPTASPSASRA